MRCTFCGRRDHPTSLCAKTWDGQIARYDFRCTYCGSRQHNTDGCPKTWGGPNPIRLPFPA